MKNSCKKINVAFYGLLILSMLHEFKDNKLVFIPDNFAIYGTSTSIIGALATSGVWFDNYIPYQVFDISCSGTEDKLLDCQHSTTSSSSCGILSHATVFCQRGN